MRIFENISYRTYNDFIFEAEISKAESECIKLGAKCSGVTTESLNPTKYTCRANEPICY